MLLRREGEDAELAVGERGEYSGLTARYGLGENCIASEAYVKFGGLEVWTVG